MDPFSQILEILVPGIVISITTAYLTVRFSLRQFYSERWWEQKWEQYEKVIEALYHIKHYADRMRASIEVGKDLSDKRKNELINRSKEGADEIDRAITIGAFVMSNEALKQIKQLRINIQELDFNNMSFFDYLDNQVAYLEDCITKVTKLAKKDLGVR